METGRLFVLLACEPLCGDSRFVEGKVAEVVAAVTGSGVDWGAVTVVYRAGTPAEGHAKRLAEAGASLVPFYPNYRSSQKKASACNACDKRMVAEVAGLRGTMIGFWNGRYRGLRNIFGYAKAAGLHRVQVEFAPSAGTGQTRLDI